MTIHNRRSYVVLRNILQLERLCWAIVYYQRKLTYEVFSSKKSDEGQKRGLLNDLTNEFDLNFIPLTALTLIFFRESFYVVNDFKQWNVQRS